MLLEIVHELKCTKGKGVLLKLDFEKAYDRVNWEFVREVLLKRVLRWALVTALCTWSVVGRPW